jgi:Lrp/AsnC family leucine-responsive transcriptional regulator
MDEISLNILKILQKKARIPNVEVARQVGLAPSAVLERIRKLEKQGIIDGYEVRLNPERFGRSLVAFIFVETGPETDEVALGRSLAENAEIQEVHYVAGQDRFMVKVRTSDTESLEKLRRHKIAALKGVHSTRTGIVLDTFKETARFPIEDPNADTRKIR